MMAAAKRVFLSYRRADFGGGAEGIVGRLYDKLSEGLGRENVFMDVDTIPLGVDFVEYLGQEVGKADVLLVVMGPQWMEEMTRRAGEEGDFVRIEIEAALERGIPVVPLLLSGAVMPKKEELPPSLERLPRRNGRLISLGRDFHPHVEELMRELMGVREGGASDAADSSVQKGLLDLVEIPAGSFWMGSPEDEEGRDEEREDRHRVTLTQPFAMARTPVTQGQWKAVMGTTIRTQAKRAEGDVLSEGEDYPIYFVSWEEAQEFCQVLTEMEQQNGVLVEGERYGLPTEAQWEYACRAGTVTATYAGDLEIEGECNAPILDGIAWYGGNSSEGYEGEKGADTRDWPEKQYPGGIAGPRKVGEKAPNVWGLHDMLGNVWEWCEDGWEASLGTQAVTDPSGKTEGASDRAVRGGSWNSFAPVCRSAYRPAEGPGYRDILLGFRPIRLVIIGGQGRQE